MSKMLMMLAFVILRAFGTCLVSLMIISAILYRYFDTAMALYLISGIAMLMLSNQLSKELAK